MFLECSWELRGQLHLRIVTTAIFVCRSKVRFSAQARDAFFDSGRLRLSVCEVEFMTKKISSSVFDLSIPVKFVRRCEYIDLIHYRRSQACDAIYYSSHRFYYLIPRYYIQMTKEPEGQISRFIVVINSL